MQVGKNPESMFTINRNPSENDLRKFGRAMLIGFGGIALLLWYITARKNSVFIFVWTGTGRQFASLGFVLLGAGLFALSKVSPSLTKTVYVAWMTVTVPIGIVMSTVMLTLLFILILPLFAVVVRLGDPLRKKLGGATYWEDYRPHPPTLERMRRPF